MTLMTSFIVGFYGLVVVGQQYICECHEQVQLTFVKPM